ncbi:MAG: ABC transporter ATP-binding protein [Gammaproteobacteria bacterium]|nr:ABC transporter ATP-binding protein [Gammaproteobacteria bacterium]
MNTVSPYVLEAINISKRFGELIALDNVTLKLRAASVHALLGENGAGKSTLVKCIMGYYQPDVGEVLFGDRQQAITQPHDALLLGIGMVYQHFTLIPNMSVAENIILSRPRLPLIIHWRKEMAELKRRMQGMPFQIPLDAPITSLSAGEKQKVEIIKQLLLNTKVLILDEPTSVLTPTEADEVLGKIQTMSREQHLSVLIITHKFREVMNFADEVTVLRKGRYVGSARVDQVSPPILAAMMVGHEIINTPLQRIPTTNPRPLLKIADLKVTDDAGVTALTGLSLSVNSGEIVGIAGVSGNGQRELMQVMAGQRAAHSGSITVNAEAYTASRAQMRRHKFHCLPEEPLRNACVASMSVADNLAFRRFDRPPFAVHNGLLNRKAITQRAKELIHRFAIKTPGPSTPVGNLSGGNVQRTVLARELADEVDVLLVANPCFGLDFGAVADIHQQIMAARNRGTAVLLISEDLDEILELSDRLLVISNGKLVHETTPEHAELTTIGKFMAGH